MENECMRRCSIPYAISDLQIKATMTYHLLEWPNSRTLTMPNTGLDVKSEEFSFFSGQNAKMVQSLGKTVSIAYKIKHISTARSSNHASWYLHKGAEDLHPHKSLHIDICRYFIHNCQNLKATKMSFSGWMDKWAAVFTNNAILFTEKGKLAIKPWQDRLLLFSC